MFQVVGVPLRMSSMTGMVEYDFEDEVKFKWRRVVRPRFSCILKIHPLVVNYEFLVLRLEGSGDGKR